MKKIYIFIIIAIIFPILGRAELNFEKPSNFSILSTSNSATLSWKNPLDKNFSKIILFRSNILIEDYFTFQATEPLCDKIYEGKDEIFTDKELEPNTTYYYIIYASDLSNNYSNAKVIEKLPYTEKKDSQKTIVNSLIGAPSSLVNEVSFNEAGIVYNYNKKIETKTSEDSGRLALFIIVKSPHDLSDKDKNAISFFIDAGTPTTILLGAGERTGVLNSYLSVFEKLPRDVLEWQDVIKIANGRWPNQKNLESEKQASEIYFNAIYERSPDMNNPNDNAAVTVIAYGLRPAERNLSSENKAIEIYRTIFNKTPIEASDWDLVRAIAYSGATR